VPRTQMRWLCCGGSRMRRLLLIFVLHSMIFARGDFTTVDMVLQYKMWDGYDSSAVTTKKILDYSLQNPWPYDGVVAAGITPTWPGYLFDSSEGINASNYTPIANVWDSGGTMSVWLRPAGRGEDDEGRVADKANITYGYGWYMQCKDSDVKLRFTIVADACDGCWEFPFDITGDKWQHLTFVYDSDDRLNNPVVYVDGLEVAVTRIRTWTDKFSRADDSAGYLVIGSRAAGDRNWEGSMDDFRLYTRPFAADEARSMYEFTKRWYQGD